MRSRQIGSFPNGVNIKMASQPTLLTYLPQKPSFLNGNKVTLGVEGR